jgi:hypothetical protein
MEFAEMGNATIQDVPRTGSNLVFRVKIRINIATYYPIPTE